MYYIDKICVDSDCGQKFMLYFSLHNERYIREDDFNLLYIEIKDSESVKIFKIVRNHVLRFNLMSGDDIIIKDTRLNEILTIFTERYGNIIGYCATGLRALKNMSIKLLSYIDKITETEIRIHKSRSCYDSCKYFLTNGYCIFDDIINNYEDIVADSKDIDLKHYWHFDGEAFDFYVNVQNYKFYKIHITLKNVNDFNKFMAKVRLLG